MSGVRPPYGAGSRDPVHERSLEENRYEYYRISNI